jgi:hypothetical protein
MSWSESDGDRWEESDGDVDDELSLRWPLHWRGLYARERWIWFEQLWSEVCMLRQRYRLAVRSGWWENEVQLEALAALSAWVCRYDSGEWDDPPGKLALLYDLERVSELLRDGVDPFSPQRDRDRFIRYLFELGCEPPAADDGVSRDGPQPPRVNGHEPPPPPEGDHQG